MDSRPEDRPVDTCTTTDLLAALAPELQLEIFSYLNLSELGRMQQASSGYNNLLMDNNFWRHKQTKQFTPTPYAYDNKNQYHAELLYRRAMSFTDADKKQVGALRLRRFLQQQLMPWSLYYRGLSFFNGYGVKVDRTIGFRHLLDALDIEDYRAAILIARLLIEAKVSDSELFQQLIPLLDKARQTLMHALILNIHKKRTTPVAKLLGHMHAHGIGVTTNFNIAEKYFLGALTNVANDTAELGRLKFDSLSNALNYEQKAQCVVDYLKTFIGRLEATPLQSVINYWSAYLALTQGDHVTAMRFLEDTPELPCAKIFLSHLLADNDLPQLGALRLIELTDTDLNISGDLFDMQMQFSTIADSVMTTKDLTNCSMIALADRVSAAYRQEMSMETLACDPYNVWWIQLAVQAGCVQSLEALQSVDAEQYPYVCYALAIIYELGVLHSEVIEPNHDKSEYYFNLAHGTDLQEYIATGHDHEFSSCEDVMDLLEAKLGSTAAPRVQKTHPGYT